jgi:hypothetical protein
VSRNVVVLLMGEVVEEVEMGRVVEEVEMGRVVEEEICRAHV